MNSLTKKTLSISLLAVFSSGAYALDPQSFNLGSFDIVPTIAMGVAQNDNILRTPQNKIDTTILTIAPNIQAVLENSSTVFTLESGLFKGTYVDSPEDDYTDWQIGANLQRQMSSRTSLDLNANYAQTHEERGTGFSEGGALPEEARTYETQGMGLGYQYITPSTKGRIRLDLSYDNREYDTATFGNLPLARDNETLGATSTFALSALQNIDFLFIYRYREIDYTLDTVESQGSQDSDERYAFVGMEWEAGSTLSGSLMVGRGKKEYVSSQRPDQSIPSWNAQIDWAPYSYSQFSFSADKSFNEANATGNGITNRSYSLSWNHSWSNRFGSSVGFSRSDANVSGINREEQTDSTSVSFSYAFRRWLDFGLSYSNSSRDSDAALFNYDQNVISLSIQASL